MADAPHSAEIDLSYVRDPDTRSALRQFHKQIMTVLDRQQMEIDALIETIMDKHVTSLSEYKLLLAKMQQNHDRTARIHGAIASATQQPPHR